MNNFNDFEKIKLSTLPVFGAINIDVAILQKRLNDLGYVAGKVDGIFGQKTAKAISWLQKDHGLPGSGVIGPKTLNLLGLYVSAVSPVTGREPITKDLIGRKDRHLHPNLRLMIEARLFPNREVPAEFVDRDVQDCYSMVMTAIAAVGITERGGNNMGPEVGQVQGVTGDYVEGGNGDAWCLDYAQCGIAFIEDFFGVESPIIASAHCMTTLRAAQKVPGLVTGLCEVGTLALAQYDNSESGHAMPVVKVFPDGEMETSEGNTSFASIRDGDGSGIKVRHQFFNGKLITRGFVRLYPYNKIP